MTERPLVIGKGTKQKRGPNTWRYRHSLGKDPATGKYRYSPWRTIHTSKSREVDAALEEYKVELNNGIFVQKATDTIGEYAFHFHSNRENELTPLAYKREELDIKHIAVLFDKIRLQELRSFMIEDAYAKARKERLFSESELSKIHMKLRQVLDHAMRDELIVKNPASDIKVARPYGKERETLVASEAERLRSLLLDTPSAHSTCVLLMLDTGMRRGEALGLTWKNVKVNGTERLVLIRQQFAADKQIRKPKSRSGSRSIAISEELADYLKGWRKTQKDDLAALGLDQTGGTPLVHCLSRDRDTKCAEAGFMDPNNFDRWFRSFCVEHGFGRYEGKRKVRYVSRTVNGKTTRKAYSEQEWAELETLIGKHPEIREEEHIHVYKTENRPFGYTGLHPHMLRHTQATLLIAAGVDPKTVQARIGHASISTTLDIYSHALPENDKRASDVFSSMLAKANSPSD